MIKLKVAGGLATSVKVTNSLQFTLFCPLILDFVDGNGFMATIRHYDESTGLVHTDTSTRIHRRWKCSWNGTDALHQTKR